MKEFRHVYRLIQVQGKGGHWKVVRDIIDLLPYTAVNDAFIAVGDNEARKREAKELLAELPRANFRRLVHRSAWISPRAAIGDGSIICAGAIVQADTIIGKHVIVNTLASIDHDCVVGDFAHVAPGAHLCGGIIIGEGAFVGAGAILVPGATVPDWGFVKAGSVVK